MTPDGALAQLDQRLEEAHESVAFLLDTLRNLRTQWGIEGLDGRELEARTERHLLLAEAGCRQAQALLTGIDRGLWAELARLDVGSAERPTVSGDDRQREGSQRT